MDKYYYLAAQLPQLFFGEKAPLDIQQFLAEAGKWLTRKEFGLLASVDINDTALAEELAPSLLTYRQFEVDLRLQLASYRKARLKEECIIKPEVKKAITDAHPLAIEINLLRLRWEYLEEIEQGHYFDFAFLVFYFLKLQILTRIKTFNKERGSIKFENLSNVIREKTKIKWHNRQGQ